MKHMLTHLRMGRVSDLFKLIQHKICLAMYLQPQFFSNSIMQFFDFSKNRRFQVFEESVSKNVSLGYVFKKSNIKELAGSGYFKTLTKFQFIQPVTQRGVPMDGALVATTGSVWLSQQLVCEIVDSLWIQPHPVNLLLSSSGPQ